MKKTISLTLTFLCSFILLVNAQTAEFSTWYFGDHAGIDFSSGSPVAIDLDTSQTRPAIRTDEGCATISDADGELLFYTNGVTIWNADHKPMDCVTGECNGKPTATAMGGGWSSTQSAVIVQMPGSSTKYYVFTVSDRYYCSNCPMKIYYSVVDMGSGLKRGGGLGEVVEGPVLLDDQVTERVAVVKSTNSSGSWSGGYWVLTHKWSSSGTRDFIAWEIASSGGLDTSGVVSATNDGALIKSNYQAGVLKASGDLENPMLAMAIENYDNGSGPIGRVDVYNFDNYSGKVSGLVSSFPLLNAYGAEFSPNGEYLYISQRYGNKSIYRYDLTATDIPQSQTSIVKRNHWERGYGALQLAPDGHIYTTEAQSMVVSRIKYPNADTSRFENIITFKSSGVFVRDGLPSPVYVNEIVTGVAQQSRNEISVSVYPNPADDFVTLKSTTGNLMGISLTDVSGREVYTGSNLNAPQFRLNVERLKGLYFVNVTSESGAVSVHKIIVE